MDSYTTTEQSTDKGSSVTQNILDYVIALALSPFRLIGLLCSTLWRWTRPVRAAVHRRLAPTFNRIGRWVAWAVVTVMRAALALGGMKKTLIGLLAVVGGLFAFLYLTLFELSAFAAAPLKAVLGACLFYVIVRYGHSELDTIQELRDGNEALARHYQSYAFIIAAALLAF